MLYPEMSIPTSKSLKCVLRNPRLSRTTSVPRQGLSDGPVPLSLPVDFRVRVLASSVFRAGCEKNTKLAVPLCRRRGYARRRPCGKRHLCVDTSALVRVLRAYEGDSTRARTRSVRGSSHRVPGTHPERPSRRNIFPFSCPAARCPRAGRFAITPRVALCPRPGQCVYARRTPDRLRVLVPPPTTIRQNRVQWVWFSWYLSSIQC